jgi:hypothetical protein
MKLIIKKSGKIFKIKVKLSSESYEYKKGLKSGLSRK